MAVLFWESGRVSCARHPMCWVTRYSCYQCGTHRYKTQVAGGWQGAQGGSQRRCVCLVVEDGKIIGPTGRDQTAAPGGEPLHRRKTGAAEGGKGVFLERWLARLALEFRFRWTRRWSGCTRMVWRMERRGKAAAASGAGAVGSGCGLRDAATCTWRAAVLAADQVTETLIDVLRRSSKDVKKRCMQVLHSSCSGTEASDLREDRMTLIRDFPGYPGGPGGNAYRGRVYKAAMFLIQFFF